MRREAVRCGNFWDSSNFDIGRDLDKATVDIWKCLLFYRVEESGIRQLGFQHYASTKAMVKAEVRVTSHEQKLPQITYERQQ